MLDRRQSSTAKSLSQRLLFLLAIVMVVIFVYSPLPNAPPCSPVVVEKVGERQRFNQNASLKENAAQVVADGETTEEQPVEQNRSNPVIAEQADEQKHFNQYAAFKENAVPLSDGKTPEELEPFLLRAGDYLYCRPFAYLNRTFERFVSDLEEDACFKKIAAKYSDVIAEDKKKPESWRKGHYKGYGKFLVLSQYMAEAHALWKTFIASLPPSYSLNAAVRVLDVGTGCGYFPSIGRFVYGYHGLVDGTDIQSKYLSEWTWQMHLFNDLSQFLGVKKYINYYIASDGSAPALPDGARYDIITGWRIVYMENWTARHFYRFFHSIKTNLLKPNRGFLLLQMNDVARNQELMRILNSQSGIKRLPSPSLYAFELEAINSLAAKNA